MAFEVLCDVQGVGGMPFHADVQRLQASAEYPGIKRGEGRAGAAAKQINFPDQFFFTYDGAAQYAALAVDPFGGGVDDQIGAILNGGLADGGSETIIYVEDEV